MNNSNVCFRYIYIHMCMYICTCNTNERAKVSFCNTNFMRKTNQSWGWDSYLQTRHFSDSISDDSSLPNTPSSLPFQPLSSQPFCNSHQDVKTNLLISSINNHEQDLSILLQKTHIQSCEDSLQYWKFFSYLNQF